jgi:hypothetical protein
MKANLVLGILGVYQKVYSVICSELNHIYMTIVCVVNTYVCMSKGRVIINAKFVLPMKLHVINICRYGCVADHRDRFLESTLYITTPAKKYWHWSYAKQIFSLREIFAMREQCECCHHMCAYVRNGPGGFAECNVCLKHREFCNTHSGF